ncbi:MAG: flavohemoglobin expression-modulating QEGLA motif protein [Proteobacteria bacterium]|nr:flavohemoglobin expression-modulating QEGLA motif protein [Pseudomonadota bacterium]
MSNSQDSHSDAFIEADRILVQAAKGIKVLSTLGWADHHCEAFLASWTTGNPKLPIIAYPKFDYQEERAALQKIIATTPDDHPVGWYIATTAQSYNIAALMLENLATPAFRECSERLYGTPEDHIGRLSNLSLAEDFISITNDFSAILDSDSDPAESLLSEEVAKIIKQRSDFFFGNYKIKVVVEEELSAKAAAGSERVRVRGSTRFSKAEVEQLLQHEVYVHSATMLNGRRQPFLKSMGLGSPRTTATQEGLATFSELISGTMDLERLRRIALRIKAIHFALSGADFLQTFEFFLEAGQPERESFKSTARIFRGGDLKGRNVFTKDVVYLKGLVSVHAFLRKAIQRRKIDYPQRLFAGRLTVGDVVRLEGSFDDGWVSKGEYLPPWAANQQGLAAYLCYNAFSNRLNLEDLRLEDFVDEMVRPLDGD